MILPRKEKKTLTTKYGSVRTSTQHVLSYVGGNFRVSSYLQYLACHAGQQNIFKEASQNLKMLALVDLDAKQIERICHFYGEKLEQELLEAIDCGASLDFIWENRFALFYVMLDGAHFMTREQGWKEVKLGRIFKATEHFKLSAQRNWIRQSCYVSHLGGHLKFLEKLEHYILDLKHLVIVGDGAPWIWEWAKANFPDQIQILDFYHAMEHLCKFAKLYFKEESARKIWIETQKRLLLANGIDLVIEAIEGLPETKSKNKESEKEKLLNYYSKNQGRMQYKTYREKGLMIGSGPIEAAHRSVLQKRLKLSGQRWTRKGLQAIANLRTLEKSNQWEHMVELVQKQKAA